MHLILELGRAEKNYRRDLWRYRELLIILAWRDVKSRAIDVAVLAESETLQHEGVLFVAKVCEREHVQFKLVPHFFEILISGLRPWVWSPCR